MAAGDSFREFVLEQLGRVRAVTARRMFGGLGLYAGDAFFALIYSDTLFFKVDDTTRPAFESRGLKPFQPFGEGTQPMTGYYEVPVDVLERGDLLEEWMGKAIGVAEAKRAKAPRPKLEAPKKLQRSRSRKTGAD